MNYEDKCDRLAAASTEIDTVLKASDDETRPLTDEDRAAIQTLETECDALKVEIAQHKADEALRQRQVARRQELATTSRGRVTVPVQPEAPGTLETSTPNIVLPSYRGKLNSFKGPDARLNAYKSGKFLASIFGHPDSPVTANAREFCRTNGINLLAQQEDSNTAGGFLVPEEFETAIIDLRETFGVFRREATVEPMMSDTKTIPRRVSGLTAYYVDENTEITESEMGWDQVRLTVRKIGVLTKYSSELGEDTFISLPDTLAGEMGYAFAVKEDNEGFLGDGTSTYGGIVGLITACAAATATTVTSASGNITFATMDLSDFESMIGKLPQYAENNAKWFISKAGWAASMLRLIDAAGGNTGAMIAGMAPKEFLGHPVVISQKMNSTLTTVAGLNGLAYLGNLRQAALLGDRRGITIAASDQRYFEFDQLAIRGTQRHDINVANVGDTSSAGSMIMLKAAGS